MSATMDRRAAESAAQVGRECGFHRTCTTPPPGGRPSLECISGASGFTLHNRLLFLLFLTSPIVSRSLLEWYCLATGEQHDVIMRAYHARTANALVNLIHLDTARELLNHLDEALAEAQHVWRNMRDGIPAHMPTSLCLCDLDAASPLWMAMVAHPHARWLMHVRGELERDEDRGPDARSQAAGACSRMS